MTDIHTHILPNIDDGPSDLTLCANMLGQMKSDGVDGIIFTPHFDPNTQSLSNFVESRANALQALKDKSLLDSFKIAYGAEIYLSPVLFHFESIDSLCISGSKYILTELPYENNWDSSVMTYLQRLIDYYMVIPIIAHVERYGQIKKDFSFLNEMRDMDCLFQVNAASLFKLENKMLFKKMLKKDYIDFIASDCHDMDKRPPNITSQYKRIIKIYGHELAEQLEYNSDSLINCSYLIL